MWKRIHSNRDPRDTLYRELRNEFDPYFQRAGTNGRMLLSKNPRLIWGAMIILLTISLVLSFTRVGFRERPAAPVIRKVNPVADGFSRIRDATDRIRTTITLKQVVDSLSAKQQLNARDSALLDSALDRLQTISHP